MEKPTPGSDTTDEATAGEIAQVSAEQSSPEQNASVTTTSTIAPIAESTEVAASEHRQAYGTAKTENLRDSGWWRVVLPAFVVLLCLALFAVPLIILISLLITSFNVTAPTHGLTWLWIVMMILEIGVAVVAVRGLIKIFMTQAGNYGN